MPTKISTKYADYSNVFSPELGIELPHNTVSNKYAIELVEGKHLFYELIYGVNSVELETLKAYIETF